MAVERHLGSHQTFGTKHHQLDSRNTNIIALKLT